MATAYKSALGSSTTATSAASSFDSGNSGLGSGFKPDIILNSPVGAKPAVYKWPLTYVSKGQKIDGAEEIIETIRWVAREYLEFKPAIENFLPDKPDLKSYDCIKSLCDKYNKIPDMVMKMNKGTSVALKTSSRASQGLLKHIIQQVYNYAVADPQELNRYSPFSSETYGETSFEFMAQLIEKNQFKPKENDTFIDLGSGVGHLVLQMAATIDCKKCYGIEIADVPANYARLMEERFKFWMNWHGKTYTDFELYHGDFFEKKYNDIIKNSTHILVNNYAFKPEVDHKLKQKFLDLKDGTQILSSKPFCSPKVRVTERHLTDIGSIMRVVEINPELKKDTVSWTPKPLPYYLHILDGSPVEKYYERQKRRQGRTAGERGKPVKRKRGKYGSDSLSDDSDDNIVYGPTTRKAWSEWCNATSMNASNRTSTDSGKTTTASSRNNSTDTEIQESAIATTTSTSSSAITATTTTPTSSSSTATTTLLSTAPSKETATNAKQIDHSSERHTSSKRETGSSSSSSRKKDSTSSLYDTHQTKTERGGGGSSSASSTAASSIQGTSAQSSNKNGHGANHQVAAKSCLDKKRDYAIKKVGSNSLQSAPPSALYSITKPAESSNKSSASKIPNIVIKVKPANEAKVISDKTSADSRTTGVVSTNAIVGDATNKNVPGQKGGATDENGKKLRQRRQKQQPTTSASSASQELDNKSAAKLNNNTIGNLSAQQQTPATVTAPTNGTRAAKKAAAAAAAAANNNNNRISTTPLAASRGGANTTAQTTTGRSQASRKRGALASDKSSSLDLLHEKTVESVSGSAGYFPRPAPGCEDHNLRSIVETPSLPKVVIKDSSMFVSTFLPKTLERYLDCTRAELEKFSEIIQQPGAREALLSHIEQERIRRNMCYKYLEELPREIKLLTERMQQALKVHCDELGIKCSARDIVFHLGALLKKHQDLSSYAMQLEASLSQQHQQQQHQQTNQRSMNPPAAHSNSAANHQTAVAASVTARSASPYRMMPTPGSAAVAVASAAAAAAAAAAASNVATLDLSLKQTS